jgi:hypothetical protein
MKLPLQFNPVICTTTPVSPCLIRVAFHPLYQKRWRLVKHKELMLDMVWSEKGLGMMGSSEAKRSQSIATFQDWKVVSL